MKLLPASPRPGAALGDQQGLDEPQPFGERAGANPGRGGFRVAVGFGAIEELHAAHAIQNVGPRLPSLSDGEASVGLAARSARRALTVNSSGVLTFCIDAAVILEKVGIEDGRQDGADLALSLLPGPMHSRTSCPSAENSGP